MQITRSAVMNNVMLYLPPANEVCEGYVFTGVCLSTGGCLLLGGGASSPGAAPGGVPAPGGACCGGSGPGGTWWRSPWTATAEGGTHPTGMHSCLTCIN